MFEKTRRDCLSDQRLYMSVNVPFRLSSNSFRYIASHQMDILISSFFTSLLEGCLVFCFSSVFQHNEDRKNCFVLIKQSIRMLAVRTWYIYGKQRSKLKFSSHHEFMSQQAFWMLYNREKYSILWEKNSARLISNSSLKIFEFISSNLVE